MKIQQKGMALLVVLLILSLMTIIAVSINDRWMRSYQRSSTIHYFRQAKWYAHAGEELARKVLWLSFSDSEENTNLSQTWATEGRVYPFDDAKLELAILDEQACFNVNALNQDRKASEGNSYISQVFQYLLANIGVDDYEAEQITAAVQDWIDEGDTASALGAKDNYYLSANPPYLTAKRPLNNISELRAVRGVSAEIFQKLRPFVCALPEKKPMFNINTLRKTQVPLLQAMLLNKLSADQISDLIDERPRKGWSAVADFMELDQVKSLENVRSNLLPMLDVKSRYFRQFVRIKMDDFEYQSTSLLKVTNESVNVIERQQGSGQINASGS